VLRAQAVSRSFGGQVVLDAVSLILDGRDRTGVVGPNGVGKTTLLRVLAGVDLPDVGTVERMPTTLSVGYLPQEPVAGTGETGETIFGYLARRTGVAAASADLDRWTGRLAEDQAAMHPYTDALEHFLAIGGADLEARAAEVADRVGLGRADATTAERFDQPVATLSGGEAARLALATILLTRADVLLLDEPTNNLDFAGLDQLEAFVDDFPGAVLVVSHDRAFLDRCIHRIVELHGQSHEATEFAGGWTEFVARRDLARSQQHGAHERYVTERDRLRDRQRRQIGWSDAGVRKARTSGEPDKNLRRKQAERSEKQAGKVKATERRLAQLERVDKPWEGWELRLSLAPTARSGDVVARLEGAVIERGGPDGFVLGPVDLEITWQDRIAVVGPNGRGKSTLLGAILGTIPLAAGRRWVGPGVAVGELDQARTAFAAAEPVADVVQRVTGLDRSATRSLLAKFGLGSDHVARCGAELSPGERSRAQVAVLMATGVNCLVLDEPTNHLDVEAIEQLEAALSTYEGTLLVVSHDRRFLESIDLTRTFDLTANVGRSRT
jgi:ATPase subunit of ABC transporter with duplicated ATPase domains